MLDCDDDLGSGDLRGERVSENAAASIFDVCEAAAAVGLDSESHPCM